MKGYAIRKLAAAVALGLCVAAAPACGGDPAGKAPPGKAVPAWFTQGTGLGLFLHWGPWSAVYNSTCGWSLFRGKQTCQEYAADIGPKFRAEKYDPNLWMKAASEGGFVYAVLTTRHHDGYELWPTKIEDDWGTKGYMGGRDLLKPYVEACRRNHVRAGFYFSPTDWMWNPKGWPHRGYPYKAKDYLFTDENKGFVAETRDQVQRNLDILFHKNVHPAVEELMTRYGKIDLLWFDGWAWPSAGQFKDRAELDIHPHELEKMVRSHQPDILINPRYNVWGHRSQIGQYRTEENRFPTVRPPGPWEFCRSIRGGWGACRPGHPRSGQPTVDVLAVLAQCRSWGGNYLANIGPFPDGTMPEYFYNLCAELKAWMAHSREALVGVGPGPWPERCNVPVTTRGEKLWYLFAWPQNDKLEYDESVRKLQADPTGYAYEPKARTLIVKGVTSPKAATLLRTGEELKLGVVEGTITIVIPAARTTRLVDVVKLQW